MINSESYVKKVLGVGSDYSKDEFFSHLQILLKLHHYLSHYPLQTRIF